MSESEDVDVCKPFDSGYDAGEENTLRILSLILGIFSVLACLSIFISWKNQQARPSLSDPSSMILFLAISDFFLGGNTILESTHPAYEYCFSENNYNICVFKSCMSQFFGLSSFMWTAAISHTSFTQISQSFNAINWRQQLNEANMNIVDDNNPISGGSNWCSSYKWPMSRYHLFCWGIPLLTTILILATNSAGPASRQLCWILVKENIHKPRQDIFYNNHNNQNNDFEGEKYDYYNTSTEMPLAAAVMIFVFPLFLILLYNVYIFFWLRRIIKQLPRGYSGEHLQRAFHFISILVLCKVIFLATRCIRLFLPENDILVISVFTIAGAPLQGIGDFFIFRAGSQGRGEGRERLDLSSGGSSNSMETSMNSDISGSGSTGFSDHSDPRTPLSGMGGGRRTVHVFNPIRTSETISSEDNDIELSSGNNNNSSNTNSFLEDSIDGIGVPYENLNYTEREQKFVDSLNFQEGEGTPKDHSKRQSIEALLPDSAHDKA